MSFPDYPLGLSENFPQIASEAPSSVPGKRKRIETEEEKTTCLAEQQFNRSDIEEPSIKRRKVVEEGQKGKEKIDEDEEASRQEESKMITNLWEEALSWEKTHNPEFFSKQNIDDSFLIHCTFFPDDVLSDVSKKPEIASPVAVSDYADQTVHCQEDGEITLIEEASLKQQSPVFEFLFNHSIFEEADNQHPIYLNINDPNTYKLFVKTLGGSNIFDESKDLDEQQKEKIFINLLDQANLWEIEKLKKDLIDWFRKKLPLIDKQRQKNVDPIKVLDWHTFARSRDLTSLQKRCEDFLIDRFFFARNAQENHLLIEILKKIKLTQLDISHYLSQTYLLKIKTAYLIKVANLIKEIPLTELNLGCNPPLTDHFLDLLKNLPLKKLFIQGDITDNSLSYFENMPLEELSLISTKLTDEGFIHFQGFKNLQVLDLTDSLITGTGFIHLKDSPLQKLILDECDSLEDEGIINLKHFKHLQMLGLSINQEMNNNILASLTDLPCLRILHLKPKNAGDLIHLKKLSLEELRLFLDVDIRSADLKNLEGLPLKKLSLISEENIKDDALTHLKKLPLEELEIRELRDTEGNGLTDAGIAHLENLSSLKKLTLEGKHLTGACLIHLQHLSCLKKLECDFPLKDENISYLKEKLPSTSLIIYE